MDSAHQSLAKQVVYTIDTMGYLEGAICPYKAIVKLIAVSLSMDRLYTPTMCALCQHLAYTLPPMCITLWGGTSSHKPRSLVIELEMSKVYDSDMGHVAMVGDKAPTSMGLKAYRPHSPWGAGAQVPRCPQPRGVGGIGPYFTRGRGGPGGQGHQGPQATGRTIIHTSFREGGLSCTDHRSGHFKNFSIFSCSLTPPTSLKTGLLVTPLTPRKTAHG